MNNGHIVRLGGDVPVDWADGEFIGLVRFSSKALKQLAELREKAPESLTRRHLSDYIEYLRVLDAVWPPLMLPVTGQNSTTLRILRILY